MLNAFPCYLTICALCKRAYFFGSLRPFRYDDSKLTYCENFSKIGGLQLPFAEALKCVFNRGTVTRSCYYVKLNPDVKVILIKNNKPRTSQAMTHPSRLLTTPQIMMTRQVHNLLNKLLNCFCKV